MTKEQAINILIKDNCDTDIISDGFHTFGELYEFRMLYNALLFNEWSKQGLYQVHKSHRHYDNTLCFDGSWFVVVAMLPSGQITNHYPMIHWDLFDVKAEPKALFEYDGHDSKDVINRMTTLAKKHK